MSRTFEKLERLAIPDGEADGFQVYRPGPVIVPVTSLVVIEFRLFGKWRIGGERFCDRLTTKEAADSARMSIPWPFRWMFTVNARETADLPASISWIVNRWRGRRRV